MSDTPKSVSEKVTALYKQFEECGTKDEALLTLSFTFGELAVLEDMCGWYCHEMPERRERIAAMAMQGLLANSYPFSCATVEAFHEACAKSAIGYADALLRELEK